MRIGSSSDLASSVTLTELAAAPDKIEDGQLIYANGSDYDPGNGEGYYGRIGGAWTYLSGGLDPDKAGTITFLDENTPLVFDVDTDNDVDFQWILDSTLTALWRWDSSANVFRFQDRTPSSVNVFNIDLENRQLVLQYDGTDLASQTMAADAFTIDSTQHIRLSAGSGHYVQVYDPGTTTQLRVYDSTGGDAMYMYHDGTDFQTGTTGISPGKYIINTPDDVLLDLDSTHALEVRGSSYQTNPTGMRVGQYTSTIGYLQVPGNGQIDIWNGGTGAIARFTETSKQCYFYGQTHIQPGNGEALTLKAGSTGNAANSWIQWDDSAASRMGFIGYGSSGNETLYMWNDVGDVYLQAGSGNPGIFYIFEDITIADDGTATFNSPTNTAHGIWIVKNSWDDSGDGMFAQTAQSVTQWGGGANFQLGDAGTNPNVDGDVNCYMSGNYTLSIKNRTGGTRRFIVYYFGG
ncbi:MAG: hypothetical protein JSW00_08940 [Thermoplasmata archaeon]|nr:MAG: hypothetical protein JSW00_08940 [Thermoplasmata archaeon]